MTGLYLKQPLHWHSISSVQIKHKLQENELSSVITQTVPLESTHRELSFEWSYL